MKLVVLCELCGYFTAVLLSFLPTQKYRIFDLSFE